MVGTQGNSTAERAAVWVLADDRAGNVSQCLGVAEALGAPFLVKSIRYTPLARLPNPLRGTSLLGIDADTRGALRPPWPAIVIAAGRRTAPVARWLKRHGGARLVQIMDPGPPGRGDFDLIAIPNHDGRRPRQSSNILPITGAPHRVTAERLAAEALRWRDRLHHLPRPRIALMVGGATKSHAFTVADAEELARKAGGMARRAGGSLMVTTSRRTGGAAEAALLAALPKPRLVYRWSDGGDNPYFAFLGAADAVIVTGDSVSMCCEACATPVPVHIYAPGSGCAAKHTSLHAELYAAGLARPLGDGLERWSHPPLNAADAIAAAIRQRFGFGTRP